LKTIKTPTKIVREKKIVKGPLNVIEWLDRFFLVVGANFAFDQRA
jgi:hypothetical protein